MNLSLYEIKNEYQEILVKLTNMEELTDIEISDSMAAIDCIFEEKAIAVAAFIKNCEAEESAMMDYEEKMYLRRSSLGHKIEKLKDYLKKNIAEVGKKKIKGREFTVSIRKNPGSVFIKDPDLISSDYKETKKICNIDKRKIRDAIDAGIFVEGASIVESTSLLIK